MKKSFAGKGFTLIELLVVIAVIGILVTGLITIINPNAQFAKIRNAQRKSDLKQINDAIKRYNLEKGSYPVTNWCGGPGSVWASTCTSPATTSDWIPGLVASGEIEKLPQDPRIGESYGPCAGNNTWTTYGYISNGTDYKLIAHCGLEGVAAGEEPTEDPARPGYAWGYWTPGAAGW